MASNEGSANDILGTISTLMQLRSMQEQSRIARQQNQVAMLGEFARLARETRTPEEQTELIATFAQLGAAPPQALQQLAASMPSATDVENIQLTEEQLASLNPDERRRVMRGSAFRSFAGMSQGQFLLDEALAGLDQEELTEGAGIGLGTRLSMPQSVAADQWERSFELDAAKFEEMKSQFGDQMALEWANYRLAVRDMTARSGLQAAELGMRIQSATQKGAPIQPLIESYGASIRHLQENKQGMSEAELQTQLNFINLQAELLKAAGVMPQEAPGLSTQDILKPNAITGYPGPRR